jgi:hypothetical protein
LTVTDQAPDRENALIGPAEIEDILADYRETLTRDPAAWFGPAPVWPLTVAPGPRPRSGAELRARPPRSPARRESLRAAR